MHRFAASGGVRARFHETKYLALLAAPLESEGLLYFAPPDRLARHTVSPGSASVVVHGSRVALRDETGRQVLDLGSSDFAHHFIDNLGGLLRGNLAALRKRNSVGFRSTGGEWVLELVPRSRTVRRVVERIEFEGRDDKLARMETQETSGDRTVTVFSEVQTGLEFDPNELERIFSVDGRDRAP